MQLGAGWQAPLGALGGRTLQAEHCPRAPGPPPGSWGPQSCAEEWPLRGGVTQARPASHQPGFGLFKNKLVTEQAAFPKINGESPGSREIGGGRVSQRCSSSLPPPPHSVLPPLPLPLLHSSLLLPPPYFALLLSLLPTLLPLLCLLHFLSSCRSRRVPSALLPHGLSICPSIACWFPLPGPGAAWGARGLLGTQETVGYSGAPSWTRLRPTMEGVRGRWHLLVRLPTSPQCPSQVPQKQKPEKPGITSPAPSEHSGWSLSPAPGLPGQQDDPQLPPQALARSPLLAQWPLPRWTLRGQGADLTSGLWTGSKTSAPSTRVHVRGGGAGDPRRGCGRGGGCRAWLHCVCRTCLNMRVHVRAWSMHRWLGGVSGFLESGAVD